MRSHYIGLFISITIKIAFFFFSQLLLADILNFNKRQRKRKRCLFHIYFRSMLCFVHAEKKKCVYNTEYNV